jgi:Flp pilus assembly pilin Flp
MYLYLWLKNWLESKEEGQGLVEYGLIIFLVSIACIIILRTLGLRLDVVFDQIVEGLNPV